MESNGSFRVECTRTPRNSFFGASNLQHSFYILESWDFLDQKFAAIDDYRRKNDGDRKRDKEKDVELLPPSKGARHACKLLWKQGGGTNCPDALDTQDGVTAKLKTENPSLDTSIRQDGVIAKLKTENPSLDTSIRQDEDPVPKVMVTNEGIKNVPAKTLKARRYRKEKPIIFSTINPVTEKLQRLQTLIISSHKWLRCQAYRTKVYDVEIIVRTRFLPECNVTRFNAFD
ncbi:hypothetical protein Tco_0980236 [Tanacetum coccineum]